MNFNKNRKLGNSLFSWECMLLYKYTLNIICTYIISEYTMGNNNETYHNYSLPLSLISNELEHIFFFLSDYVMKIFYGYKNRSDDIFRSNGIKQS